MFTEPPALVVAGGVESAAVVGVQLPLVVVGHPVDEVPGEPVVPVLAPVDDDPQPTNPTAMPAAATAATLSLMRPVRTLNTKQPPPLSWL